MHVLFLTRAVFFTKTRTKKKDNLNVLSRTEAEEKSKLELGELGISSRKYLMLSVLCAQVGPPSSAVRMASGCSSLTAIAAAAMPPSALLWRTPPK